MDTATPQPEGSNFDAIRQPNVAHCSGEIASVNWAYGMPLSYVLEMANHWLGFHDHTARTRSCRRAHQRPGRHSGYG